MSARMREKRARRHEEYAQRYGCDCQRHKGQPVVGINRDSILIGQSAREARAQVRAFTLGSRAG